MNLKNAELSQKFKKKGFVLIKSFLKDNEIKALKESLEEPINLSVNGKWRFIRVYREFLSFSKKINVFGIDYPFHKKVKGKNFYDVFKSLNYKKKIIKILNWENFNTNLVRVHLNSKFKYQGEWHRDGKNYPSPNNIQLIIYLENESGFRIIPKNKHNFLPKCGLNINRNVKDQGFRELPEHIYKTIKAKKGDILFFESGLLHQGFITGQRLHIHVGHERLKKTLSKNKSKMNNLNFTKDYFPEANLNNTEYLSNYQKKGFFTYLKRAKVTLLYFFPRFRYIIKNINNKLKYSVFHSTIWQ